MKIEDFVSLLDENISNIMKVLEGAQHEMKIKYPDLDTLGRGSFYWLERKYNDEFLSLERNPIMLHRIQRQRNSSGIRLG